MKKFISLMLVLMMAFIYTVPAMAAINPPADPQDSDYFSSYGTALSDYGGHVMHVTFSTVGVGLCSELGVANYWVQKLMTDSDGNQYWVDVTSVLTGSIGYNVNAHTFGINFQGIGGETYRVKCIFSCVKYGVGSETKSYTSGRKTIN
jgi:hypothetical protein